MTDRSGGGPDVYYQTYDYDSLPVTNWRDFERDPRYQAQWEPSRYGVRSAYINSIAIVTETTRFLNNLCRSVSEYTDLKPNSRCKITHIYFPIRYYILI